MSTDLQFTNSVSLWQASLYSLTPLYAPTILVPRPRPQFLDWKGQGKMRMAGNNTSPMVPVLVRLGLRTAENPD